jgi:hypothetical protein
LLQAKQAKLAAAKIMMRVGWVRMFERTLRDQNAAAHRPPAGQVNTSRIPYLRASS